ncbi:LPXTG cell wall anchor domain-containing protein [Enterococcus sp. 669A]|uniref:LPXTG cell wall anchor domain-containing protein n=1 Tax=Candidatus Enterococcus moelleringii TaxID=2815325 RepID=A0ABS3L7D5_9ENTE|nr:LPXTG cell wall anchor domain-containing protein [Enterococcus sp. 669A]MBO1304968.1 LPXTG cell wall anchor domain-containing protein [Enterococcus sp. 669A]
MKKVVLFSLLVLFVPIAAFAETTESVPNATTATNATQEQTIDSMPAVEETIDSDLTTNSSTPEAVNDDATTASTVEENKVPDETTEDTTKESTTESTGTKESETPEVKDETKESEEPAEKEKPKEYTPAVIRDLLSKDNYGIDQTELAGYTDQQLASAWQLFERYNYDIIGMDMGTYVRVLRMVHKDKVISWEATEKALAFNPNLYTTCDELIQNVDQLYNYIQVLYPAGNGFVALSHYSKEELVHMLNHLAPAQQDLIRQHGSLFAGVVNWIQASSHGNAPIDNGPRKNEKSENTGTQNVVTTTKPTPVTAKKAEVQTTAQKEYPKTGEKTTVYLTVAGGIIIILAGCILVFKKKRAH